MIFKANTTISFYDLDARGDVTLTALLKHINLSAGANANDLGIGINDTLPLGLTFVLQRFALRIYDWPVFGQEVTIRTWPAEISKGAFRRNGDMTSLDGKKLAEWTGLWVLIDINKRKVKRPKALPVTLPEHGLLDVTIEADKIEVPQNAELIASYPHIVRFSEIDVNKHMNNANYGNLIANVLEISESPLKIATKWREVQFNYLAETKRDEEVVVEFRQLGEDLYVTGTEQDRMVFVAKVNVDEAGGPSGK